MRLNISKVPRLFLCPILSISKGLVRLDDLLDYSGLDRNSFWAIKEVSFFLENGLTMKLIKGMIIPAIPPISPIKSNKVNIERSIYKLLLPVLKIISCKE